MTNVIRLSDYWQPKPAIADLRVGHDSFSVRVSCVDDKLFWVRIEPLATGSVKVTDFKISDQSRHTLSSALEQGLAASNAEPITRLRFTDLVPSGPADPLFAQKLTSTLEDIKVACEHYAQLQGAMVKEIDANSVDEKVHADVILQPAPISR